MNRFVVEIPNDYDQYTVEEHYPIETDLSREDLEQELRTFYDDVMSITYTNINHAWQERGEHLLDLGGTGLIVEFYLIAKSGWDKSGTVYDWKFDPQVKIFTIDEWFASAN